MLLQVLTKALQLHPAASGLWSYAASWEFEHNSNAAAARTLMQRGLRMCKGSRQLWLEYFRMELMYARKLRKRRHILGLDALSGVSFQAVSYALGSPYTPVQAAQAMLQPMLALAAIQLGLAPSKASMTAV